MFELKLCYVFKRRKEKTEKKNLIELKIYITIRREVYVYIGEYGAIKEDYH